MDLLSRTMSKARSHGLILPSKSGPSFATYAKPRRLQFASQAGVATRLASAKRIHQMSSTCLTASALAGGETVTASTDEVLVEEVMNPHPVVLSADTPVKEAVRLLLEKDISGAPVVDKSGKLVGILSESDLIWKGVGAPQAHFIIPPVYIGFADLMLSWRDNAAFEDEVHKILSRTVGEAMTADPLSVPPRMTMSEAATIMVNRKVNRLPVVQDGKVVGVITRHDVLMGLVASNSPFL